MTHPGHERWLASPSMWGWRGGVLAGWSLLAVAVAVAVGCSGDDVRTEGEAAVEGDDDGGSPTDREAYVDALAFSMDEAEYNSFTPEENRCMAEAEVDVLGVDTLRDNVSPERIRSSPKTNLVDHGVEIDEQQARALYDAYSGCADLRRGLVDHTGQILRDMSGGGEVDVACLDQTLDDTMVEEFIVDAEQRGFQTGDESSQPPPELTEAYVDWLGGCIDLRGTLLSGLVSAITEDPELPPGAVGCIEQGFTDDVARRTWVDLFSSPTPELPDEIRTLVTSCAGPEPPA
jgi:hypothetical protein